MKKTESGRFNRRLKSGAFGFFGKRSGSRLPFKQTKRQNFVGDYFG